ncbi:C40 family peptidase [Hirschia litorea]|uniref:C40 family peptidase n=1 Tax=Hirschia litorea TaxID=1199156 RepID=A0ABW2IJR2_9PROT
MTMEKLNPRLHPFRESIAASYLKGRVDAQRYSAGQSWQVQAPITGLYRTPQDDSALDTQAQQGEIFTVYDEQGGWSWGQLESDNYVGWIRTNHLVSAVEIPTHKVSVLRTIVFTKPDLKTTPLMMLSLNASVSIIEQEGDYSRLKSGGWVFSNHLSSKDEFHQDYVSVAEKFLNAPYLWGGKDSFGLDCSGLVQSSMVAAGFSVPRDASMQEEAVGTALDIKTALTSLQRGDLIFWPGHVGIMQDAVRLLHANAHHMMCASEPVVEAIERIGQKETAVRSIKRPSQLFQS